jgi:hypothetical protein
MLQHYVAISTVHCREAPIATRCRSRDLAVIGVFTGSIRSTSDHAIDQRLQATLKGDAADHLRIRRSTPRGEATSSSLDFHLAQRFLQGTMAFSLSASRISAKQAQAKRCALHTSPRDFSVRECGWLSCFLVGVLNCLDACRVSKVQAAGDGKKAAAAVLASTLVAGVRSKSSVLSLSIDFAAAISHWHGGVEVDKCSGCNRSGLSLRPKS